MLKKLALAGIAALCLFAIPAIAATAPDIATKLVDVSAVEAPGTQPAGVMHYDTPLAITAPAATTVQVGNDVSKVVEPYVALLGTLASILATWLVQKFTGIKLDEAARKSIEDFTNNSAGAYIVKFTTEELQGKTIDVRDPDIASIAESAFARIPDAMKRFGWGPEQIKQRIVEKIGLHTAALPPTTVAAAPSPAA